MNLDWTRNPHSVDGPALLEASREGLDCSILEDGNHWVAKIKSGDRELWSYPARTEEEAKTRVREAFESGEVNKGQ